MGIGAVSVLAGISLSDGLDDDPEERRRQQEAREAAQNLGAVLGLAAGTASAAIRRHRQDTTAQEGPRVDQTLE